MTELINAGRTWKEARLGYPPTPKRRKVWSLGAPESVWRGARSLTTHTHGVPAPCSHLSHGYALQRLQRPRLQLGLQSPVAQLSMPEQGRPRSGLSFLTAVTLGLPPRGDLPRGATFICPRPPPQEAHGPHLATPPTHRPWPQENTWPASSSSNACSAPSSSRRARSSGARGL